MRDVWESKYPIREILKQDFHKNVFLKKLLEIPDCPNKIFWRGNFKSESDLAQLKFLVVVGSRNLSTYGKDVIKFLIEGLRGSPVCIISGLALGADSEAHKNAIKNNLWTIVVPGSGIKENVLYPRSNTKLGKEILEHSGLFLNEFEPDFPATLWSFPARNRIMAAIADAVLIVEAGEKSGTLITARLALEYNKDVLCVPGQIFHKNSFGTNKLIGEGAKIIIESDDILESLGLPRKNDKKKSRQDKVDLSVLTDHEKKLWEILEEEVSKDELQEISKLSVTDFLMALTMLEMKNLIQEDAGLIRRKI